MAKSKPKAKAAAKTKTKPAAKAKGKAKTKGKAKSKKPAAPSGPPRGGAEELAWVKEVGLDVSAKPDTWRANIILEPGNEAPVGRYASSTDTRVELWVTTGGWQLYLCNAGKEGTYYPADGWTDATIPDLPTPTLATVRDFIHTMEKRLGVTFRRDLPLIRTNIHGGTKAITTWLAG